MEPCTPDLGCVVEGVEWPHDVDHVAMPKAHPVRRPPLGGDLSVQVLDCASAGNEPGRMLALGSLT